MAEWRATFVRRNCLAAEAPVPQQEDPQGRLRAVHVAYSSNARQFPGILLSMTSLARSIGDPRRLAIHIIVSPEDMEEAKAMVGCFRRGWPEHRPEPRVLLHGLFRLGFDLQALRQRWRPELLDQPHTFVRFYLHVYLPEAPRVLWLDSDTIVKGDVSPLYRMRMQHPVAASLELGQHEKGRLFLAHRWLNQSEESMEWNTGVALFDLDRWRSENLTAECEKWTVRVNAVGGDQIGMNLALYGRFDKIEDWRWNLRGWNTLRPPRQCLETAKILHWSGNVLFTKKPWLVGGLNASERIRWGYDQIEPYEAKPACELSGGGNGTAASRGGA